ncbi:hypothetical protein Tco_0888132 [Tanacetum coccineum]
MCLEFGRYDILVEVNMAYQELLGVGPRSISSRIFNYYILDTAYRGLLDTAYRTLFFVVSCEVQARIRRIFLDGYGVLDVRLVFFIFLCLSFGMGAF